MRTLYFLPALICLSLMLGCKPEAKTEALPAQKPKPAAGTLKSLGIKDTKPGTGKVVGAGDQVFVLYTGKLANGTVFDSTEKRDNEPFTFVVGEGHVIKGWDQG